jgi:hypothetical protein
VCQRQKPAVYDPAKDRCHPVEECFHREAVKLRRASETSKWIGGREAFFIFLAFAIGGFLLVAALMVFVEMASDIGKIRYMLEKR